MKGKISQVCLYGVVFVSLLLLVYFVYSGGLMGPFLLDDVANLSTSVIDELSFDSVWYALKSNDSGVLGRPISALSFSLSGYFTEWSTVGYKTHNLAIHMVTAVMLFWFLLRVLVKDFYGDRTEGALLALLIASIWAFHPLQVSTVLYAVQRMAQLSALFIICSLLCYTIGRQQIGAGQKKGLVSLFIGVPVFSMLAIFSKENGVIIPVLIVLVELIVFGGKKARTLFERKSTNIALLFLVVLPMLLGCVFFILKYERFIDYSGRNFNLEERLLTQIHVVFFYLKMIVIPKITTMGLYHDDFMLIKKISLGTIGIALFFLGLLISAFVFREKNKLYSLGITLFFASHLLESTFIPLELIFEHRNYLGLAGISMAVVSLVVFVKDYRRVGVAIVVAIVVLLAFLTWIRGDIWASELMLNYSSVQNHPKSLRSRIGYANVLLKNKRYEEALEHLKIASSLQEHNAGPDLHMIQVYCVFERMPNDLFDKALMKLENYPIVPYALSGLESTIKFYGKGWCPNLTDVMLNDLIKAALKSQINQGNKTTMYHLYFLQGQLFGLAGKHEKAIESFDTAFTYEKDGLILTEKFNFLLSAGFMNEAKDTIQQLWKLDSELGGTLSYKIKKLEHKLENIKEE